MSIPALEFVIIEDFHCADCRQREMMLSSAQALCTNDRCHVIAWDPTLTMAQLVSDMHTVTLHDLP